MITRLVSVREALILLAAELDNIRQQNETVIEEVSTIMDLINTTDTKTSDRIRALEIRQDNLDTS